MLRSLTINDAEAFFKASNDLSVHHYMLGCYCDSIQQAKKYIRKMLSYSDAKIFAITTKEIPFIGALIITNQKKLTEKHGITCYEVSYFVDKKLRRKGFATKAVAEILNKYKNSRIYFSIEECNIASLSVIEKFNPIQEREDFYYIDT